MSPSTGAAEDVLECCKLIIADHDGTFQNNYFTGMLLQGGQFFAKASIFLLLSQLFTIHRPMRIAI